MLEGTGKWMGFGDTGDKTLGSLLNSGSSGGCGELIYAEVERKSAVMVAKAWVVIRWDKEWSGEGTAWEMDREVKRRAQG